MLRRRLLAAVVAVAAAGATAGASPATADPFSFLPGAKGFDGAITNSDGSPSLQAGSRPYALTISFAAANTFGYLPQHPPGLTLEQEGEEELLAPVPSSDLRDASIDLPAGVVVNPAATPVRCTEAEFGFDVGGFGIIAHIDGRLRTGGDYGLSADVLHVLAKLPVLGVRTTLWGNPSAPSHDTERGYCDTTQGR